MASKCCPNKEKLTSGQDSLCPPHWLSSNKDAPLVVNPPSAAVLTTSSQATAKQPMDLMDNSTPPTLATEAVTTPLAKTAMAPSSKPPDDSSPPSSSLHHAIANDALECQATPHVAINPHPPCQQDIF